MSRQFNTAGPCDPKLHYLLPPERRLPRIGRLFERAEYFAIVAPRRSGKTTLLRALAERLRAEGHFAALVISCEVDPGIASDFEGAISALLETLKAEASSHLPAEQQPPEPDRSAAALSRVAEMLTRWAGTCPLPIVLFLDDYDSLPANPRLSLLRQLRSGFPSRPRNFPQSMGLIGLRDVRDYRLMDGSNSGLGSPSPYNINTESFRLGDFTAEEIAELYRQHTHDTGQIFEDEALANVFELSGGQPWLVNALARHCVEVLHPDPAQPITRDSVEAAKEWLVQCRHSLFGTLVGQLGEAQVQPVIAALVAGELISGDPFADDLPYVQDLGLVRAGALGLGFANPIYAEVVLQTLTEDLEAAMSVSGPGYVMKNGQLDFAGMLRDFCSLWLADGESLLKRAPYQEAAAQLVFMAFLHKIVNGGGSIERELAVGRGRADLCVRWPYREDGQRKIQSQAIELKVWRDKASNPTGTGVEQLGGYLERLGLKSGTLLIFDARTTAPPLPERQKMETREHRGLMVDVCWL